MRPLSPGELAERLAGLPIVIEGHSVEIGSVPIEGYYGGRPRPTGEVSLIGDGHVGRGENVDWTPEDQARFADVCDELVPRATHGATTVGAVSRTLRESGAHAYHRAAVEAAAIDLALHQASTNLFKLAGRPARPARFCWSIGREVVEREGPLAAVQRLLGLHPDARIKIDCPAAGWRAETWAALAATGRIVIVDFKREGSIEQLTLAHRYLPDAWFEDPPLVQAAAWLGLVSLDGHVLSASDPEASPVRPAAINVKAPRVGGLLEALRVLEWCAREGRHAYVGGMFEVAVGRDQARDLASLFTPDAWNDLAPLESGATSGPSQEMMS